MRNTYKLPAAAILFLMAAASQAQTISPASVTLKPSQTQSFSVTNAAKGAYTWSLNPGVGSAGTVTSAGLYTAPASITAVTTVTLDATEPGHPGLTASITLMPLVGISVSPTWISLTNGQSAAFTATITGASNTAVTWSRPQVGTITSGGVYTVPATLTSSQNITVTATSVVDPTKSASLTIALVPTIGVALNPTSTSLTAGQSTALNAAVTGTTNTGLNWSMSPQVGTLSGGVYTAPSPIPSAESVTITATSQASTGRSANVTLSLVPVSVGVSPSSASLTSGQSKTFTASVSGSSNTGVTWSVSPSVGTVSGGVYKAPALVSTAQSVTVKATSAADSTKSASAVVSLTPSASINMTPTTASLQAGQSTSFNATVSGTSNTSVNWSMSPSVGTLSGGVYTAPTPVASAQTVTITAASAAVPSETVTAKVTLVPVAITVSPTSASLTGGQSTTLTANVSGSSNTSVNWSVSPSVGAVVGGVYTAPATIASAQTVTVTASSAADATKSATSKISLVPVALSVSPTSASLSAGQSKTLTATVTGSSNTSVNWSLSPAVGSIVAGVYTAPSTIASAQTVIATASSAANSAVTASASISLVPTAPTVSISVSPTSASLSSGQSATIVPTVTGSSNTSVTWSISPAVGTLAGGVYTAPTTISTQQTVTVTATSVAAATQSASASITLLPTVTVAVVPATITLGPSQSQQFNASLSGTSNPNVTWSISPSVGSFSNGLYQAPATINSQQNVTVTATSSAQPSQSGSATITLVPTVGIALSPSSISLTGGQSTQFNVTNAGAPASASTVTWTLAPPVGNITNGVYTAPVSISSLQTIVLTVASIANQSQTATANITLSPAAAPSTSVSPGTASLTPSGTQQFTATGLGTNPVWTISPSTGTITTGGLYSAPSSVTTQTTVTVTATNATNSSQTATATVTLSPAASQSPTSITLPLEVMGANGTQVPVSFNIPTGTSLSGLQLYLQIHGLKYETEASVQVNGGAWLPINTSTVTLQGYAAGVGGIGGGFATLKLTMNLPAGSITTGQNTLTFQFIATNGITSGYRVLNFNIQTSNGTQLIPASTFVQDDPSTWQAPLNDATDIQAGQTLYTTGHLTVPGSGAIQATCSMCHTQNGWDLKYFNYSNYSIQQRAMFHGLTAQQGNQIASYIRSLTSPAPASARPWNPPYQPGVGLDSVPVSEWAAGAGLDAVLDDDTDTLQYVMPGGSTANMAWNAFLNQREIPVAIQLRDWNNWLPTIHPVDAFGNTFTSNGLNTMYSQVRAELVPNDAASYSLHHMDLLFWLANQNGFYDTVRQAQTSTVWNNPAYTRSIYSVAQWLLVKNWEINQEYGLEGMPQAAFGPQAENRAWYSNQAFFLSPQMLKIPQSAPGIGGTTPDEINSLHMYDAFAWYHLQLMLNDGNGTASGTWPIDRGYSLAYLEGTLTWDGVTNSVRMPTAGMFMEWFAKVLQSGDLQDVNPYFLVDNPTPYSTFSGVSASEKVQLMNTWITLWLADAQHFTTAEFLKTPGVAATFSLLEPGSFTGDLVWALPALRFQGVETSLLNQLVTFASGIWPSYNWAADLNQPCTQGGLTVTCK